MEPQLLLISLVLSAPLLFLIFVQCLNRRRHHLLPPSPALRVPIIGHMHLLGPILHQSLDKLSKKYGTLYSLQFGSVPSVVASSPHFAKMLLQTNELAFNCRIETTAVKRLTYEASLAFAPYGEYWRFIKKLSMNQLLGSRSINGFQHLRAQETRDFLGLLAHKAQTREAVNVTEELLKLTNNVISRMMLGEAEEARDVVRGVTQIFGEFNVSDFIWLFKKFDLQGFGKRIEDLFHKFDTLVERVICQREEMRRKNGNQNREGDARDFLDILLDIGGGGGDIGKKINHGGGDGGDDDGDDDDYFDEFDDGDEGDEGGLFRRRMIFEELFDRKFVDAVLNEWQRTMMDLPAGLRQAYEMGLVSSAQMVKFLAINARPTTSRFISRTLPQALSRSFIGRLLADPAFLYRFLLEEAATIGCSVWWEFKNRKDRIKQEWDLALINVLTAATCNALVVWSLAPCRSYGNTFRFDLQNTLQKLPNNIFEKSYPLREFDLQKRIQCFLFKAAELCMVGLSAGAVQGALSNSLASKKEGRLSVTVPSVSSNALGYGAFLGIYANLRYQLLCGFDRAMVTHFDVIGVALFFSTAFRVLNVQLGETSKRAWLGVEADPLAQSDDLLKVYNRTSENAENPSSKWFISKNAVVSGLGLLGLKQKKADGIGAESSAPKARRKRIVRKKVAAGSA